jgi:hypothetical protein
MSLYTSDIDAIYEDINAGKIDYNRVRIISSARPQSIKILEDFPNITEVFCPIVCPLDKLSNLGDLILARYNLIRATFMIFIPESEQDEEDPPVTKKRRLIKLSPYDRAIKFTIPNIIRQLGPRARYMKLDFQIIDADTTIFTFIMIQKGVICMNSNAGLKNIIVTVNGDRATQLDISEIDLMISGENNIANNIFQALVETNNLQGIITFGDAVYNLDSVDLIHEVTILSRNFNSEYPLNLTYLENLISKTEIVNVIYSDKTFQHHHIYSEIIKRGTSGRLTRIKAIVPINDVNQHITNNPNLEEIHIHIRNEIDIDLMKSIIQDHIDRPITYYIHYNHLNDDEYWLELKGLGDIVFENIIITLMPV